MASRSTSAVNKRLVWLLVSVSMASTRLLQQKVAAQQTSQEESCAPCQLADNILLACNTSLQMHTWPGQFIYQPSLVQAPCACNQNFYDLATSCLQCQSSDSAKLSVKPAADYKLVCQSMGQQEWPAVYIPGQTQTTTSVVPTGSSLPTNGSDPSNSGSSHSGLSSGAVAGIIVSAIALLVALAVAGYVFTRRKRDLAKRQEDEELYKFQETARNSYIEAPMPQYTGMIEPSLPPLPQITNLRVMNPDSDDDYLTRQNSESTKYSNTFSQATKGSSPGWRRGSFDDD